MTFASPLDAIPWNGRNRVRVQIDGFVMNNYGWALKATFFS